MFKISPGKGFNGMSKIDVPQNNTIQNAKTH